MAYAEAIGQGRIDALGVLGDLGTPRRVQVLDAAHEVQALGEHHQDHPHVLGDAEQQAAQVATLVMRSMRPKSATMRATPAPKRVASWSSVAPEGPRQPLSRAAHRVGPSMRNWTRMSAVDRAWAPRQRNRAAQASARRVRSACG